ncbi:MAG: YhcH/YjgK/YiaL family protein [Salibacteraceae bacterium]|jgi:YhcH/YjgK/YiaL family protein
MIFDHTNNLNLYFKGEWVDQVIHFYKTLTVDTPNGVYPLDGEKSFCKVLDYKTKAENWITESHQKYVDVQISLAGQELIEIYDNTKGQLEQLKTYDEKTDCIFYKYPPSSPICTQLLTPGFMGIYFPQDIHATQIAVENSTGHIKKAVFKVSEKLILN